MPTWAFGSSANNNGQPNGVTSLAITKPASTADGDLLVAVILGDAAATLSASAGGATWTQATGSPQSVAGNIKVAVWWKVASGEGTSHTFTSTGGNIYEGVVGRWTNPTWSFDNSSGAAATATTINAPSVAVTGADDLVLRIVGSWNATSLTFASGTSRITSGSNGDLIRVYDQDFTTTPTGTDTATANASNQMCAFTLAFIATAASAFDPSTVPWAAQSLPTPTLAVLGI